MRNLSVADWHCFWHLYAADAVKSSKKIREKEKTLNFSQTILDVIPFFWSFRSFASHMLYCSFVSVLPRSTLNFRFLTKLSFLFSPHLVSLSTKDQKFKYNLGNHRGRSAKKLNHHRENCKRHEASKRRARAHFEVASTLSSENESAAKTLEPLALAMWLSWAKERLCF